VKRGFWIAFGAGVQILFLFTVYQLFVFLYTGGGDLLTIEPLPLALSASWRGLDECALGYRLAWDVLLLAQFGISHSFFLYPAVRARMERFIPEQLYGAFYALIACVTLLLTAWLWQPLPGVVYQTQGILGMFLVVGFLASWAALFYSINLTGLGYQTGFTPWMAFLRRRGLPKRYLVTTGAYRFLRHPIYLSFLGLLWFTPRMTTDRFLLATLWTGFVYVGSVLKDRRLIFFLGDRYRAYMARVPGYPGIPWGPLARGPRS
jgi:protein-S-isoprenylcysteine O-methyltransferase Ste14